MCFYSLNLSGHLEKRAKCFPRGRRRPCKCCKMRSEGSAHVLQTCKMSYEGSARTLQVLQSVRRGVSAHFADVQSVRRGGGAHFARFFEGDYQLLSAGFTFHTSKAQHTDKKAAPIQNQLIAVKS